MRFWLLHELHADSPLCNESVVLHFAGAPPLLALIDAVWLVEDGITKSDRPNRLQLILRRLRRFGFEFVVDKVTRRLRGTYQDLRVATSRVETRLRQRLGLALPLVVEHRALVSAYLDALVAHRCTGSRHAAALYFASEWCLDRLPLGELSDVALREIDSFHDALFEGRGLRDSPTASTQISRWSTRNSDHSTSPSRAHPAERGADPSLGLLCDSEGVQVQLERIDRVRAKCVADPRVQAALIYGSFFRGEADEHSDIEFWVYLSKEALPDFDPRAWLEAIAPLRALFENEFGTSVAIFDDAMRGEFHCVSEDRISEIREWRSLEGTGQPEMIVVDRRGLLSRALREVAQRGTPQASAAIAC